MHLSNLKLWNFRKYGNGENINLLRPNLNLDFSEGLNVLVGENDSGKTAIIDAIKLVLKTHSYEWIKISEEDFFRNSNNLRIELIFKGFRDEEARHFTEWLGWEGVGEAAQPYLKLIYDVSKNDYKIFPADIKAGSDNNGHLLTAEAKEYLRITYLKPLRDAKTELVSKKNSRLSQIFQEHKAFKGQNESHYLVEKFRDLNKSIEKYFEGKNNNDEDLLEELMLGKNLKSEIDGYLQSFYDTSKFTEISVTGGDLKGILEKLELLIKDEVNIGLGTLNRLFMASELLHLNKQDWDGVRLGLIEELEAHLHPQAQMQIIESLQSKKNIQLILTTHSPNLASKVKLENLIFCSNNFAFPLGESYTLLDSEDYGFLERFLDVTKANLFFAKGIIMVEGWSEELLIPALAKKMKSIGLINKDITESGVSIVNVASTAFMRYSKIFLRNIEPYIQIPICIITDTDIRYFEKVELHNEEGVIQRDANGKIMYDYIALPINDIGMQITAKMMELEEEYNKQSSKIFPAPNWTLEYCLSKSNYVGTIFKEIVKNVHSGTNWDAAFEKELAKKLISKGLNKVEIAYQLAARIEADIASENSTINLIGQESDSIDYLINAIKYVCGN